MSQDSLYYKPWIGSDYSQTGILILGESAYISYDETGKEHRPDSEHCIYNVETRALKVKQHKFMGCITRAITNKADPTEAEIVSAWKKYAYTLYVQEPLKGGTRTRPTPEQWAFAKSSFNMLLKNIEPLPKRIIVIGKQTWANMPETQIEKCADKQAYVIENHTIWCSAVKHPAAGLGWQQLATVLNEPYSPVDQAV